MQVPISTLMAGRGLIALAALIALAGCRIEERSAADVSATAAPAGSFENKAFDPAAQVQAAWTVKAVPELTARAGELGALRKAMAANLDAAGAQHGYRERGAGAPWNMATLVKGKIVSVDTESSAGKIGVDVDGDGQADAEVQIGPIMRGTSIRDGLSFISFTSYANQIDFAQLANAYNKKAFESALKDLPRDALKGKDVQVIGVFTTEDGAEMPVVTPIELKLAGPG
jgi:predicted lipoprotein